MLPRSSAAVLVALPLALTACSKPAPPPAQPTAEDVRVEVMPGATDDVKVEATKHRDELHRCWMSSSDAGAPDNVRLQTKSGAIATGQLAVIHADLEIDSKGSVETAHVIPVVKSTGSVALKACVELVVGAMRFAPQRFGKRAALVIHFGEEAARDRAPSGAVRARSPARRSSRPRRGNAPGAPVRDR